MAVSARSRRSGRTTPAAWRPATPNSRQSATPAQMTAFTKGRRACAPGFALVHIGPGPAVWVPHHTGGAHTRPHCLSARAVTRMRGGRTVLHISASNGLSTAYARRAAPNTRAAGRGAGPEECLPSGPVPSLRCGPRPDGRSRVTLRRTSPEQVSAAEVVAEPRGGPSAGAAAAPHDATVSQEAVRARLILRIARKLT